MVKAENIIRKGRMHGESWANTALELFCSLTERLDDIKHYIDHGLEEHNGVINFVHGKVYSDIF